MTPVITRRPQAAAFQQGYGMGDVSSTVRRLVGDTVASSVSRVVIRSNLSPDIVLDPRELGPTGTLPGRDGVAPGEGYRRQGGIAESLLAFVRPEIEIDTIAGQVRVAPWGPPTTNLFWPLAIVGATGLAVLTILAVKQLRRR